MLRLQWDGNSDEDKYGNLMPNNTCRQLTHVHARVHSRREKALCTQMWDLGRVKANKNQHHDVRCVSILSKLISSAICTYPYVWYVTTLQWYISESHVVRVYMLLCFFSLTDTKYIYRSLGQFKNGERETETKMERNGKVKSKIMTEKIWKKWRSKGKKMWNVIHGPICTKIFYSNRIWLCENEIYQSLLLFDRQSSSKAARSAREERERERIYHHQKKEYRIIIKSHFVHLSFIAWKSCYAALYYSYFDFEFWLLLDSKIIVLKQWRKSGTLKAKLL